MATVFAKIQARARSNLAPTMTYVFLGTAPTISFPAGAGDTVSILKTTPCRFSSSCHVSLHGCCDILNWAEQRAVHQEYFFVAFSVKEEDRSLWFPLSIRYMLAKIFDFSKQIGLLFFSLAHHNSGVSNDDDVACSTSKGCSTEIEVDPEADCGDPRDPQEPERSRDGIELSRSSSQHQ